MALPQQATAEELLSGLPHRLHHVFQPWAESSPDQPALIGDGKVWTYGQLPGIVDGAAAELRKLGQHVVETEDALEIHPRPLTPGVEIETYGDHRFAMSFGVLGCHDLRGDGSPWLSIRHPGCCAKTFPAFFDLLARLRAASH
jgi:hypothetical protein